MGFCLFLIFVGVYSIYSVVLVSDVQQSECHTYTHIHSFLDDFPIQAKALVLIANVCPDFFFF